MDPLSAAGTFSTSVGLVGQYKSSRNGPSGKNFNEFLTWLIQSGQADLKSLIEANLGTTVSIKALLNTQRSDFLERLEKIKSALSAYASSIEGFRPLAENAKPKSLLSAQAQDFLCFYETSGAGALLEVQTLQRNEFHSLDSVGGWAADEPRFMEDDLNLLLLLGLITLTKKSKGGRIFHYTRRAADLFKNNRVVELSSGQRP
jgi:hypothetical protein